MSRECLVEFIFVGSQVDRVALSEHECYMMEDMLFFSSCNVGSSSTSFSSSVLFEGGVFFSKGNNRYLFFFFLIVSFFEHVATTSLPLV